MSALADEDIKEFQEKIKGHIEELEKKVKNGKIYWQNDSALNFDTNFIQNFIDSHYNEIVHHLSELKHHLEQISYHKTELQDLRTHLINTHKESPQDDSLNLPETCDQKRPDEDKHRIKNQRLARSASLRYVQQWEKMLDGQKEENSLTSVRRRFKSGPNLHQVESESENDVSKVMVKSRVMQFEGIQKPKRASSTIEAFLDFPGDKLVRVQSHPILEELEECDDEMSKWSDCETISKEEEDVLPPSNSNDLNESDDKTKSTVPEDADPKPSEDQEAIEKDHDIKLTKDESKESLNIEDVDENRKTAQKQTIDVQESTENIDSANSKKNSTKPRIVEIHYKQDILSMDLNPPVILIE